MSKKKNSVLHTWQCYKYHKREYGWITSTVRTLQSLSVHELEHCTIKHGLVFFLRTVKSRDSKQSPKKYRSVLYPQCYKHHQRSRHNGWIHVPRRYASHKAWGAWPTVLSNTDLCFLVIAKSRNSSQPPKSTDPYFTHSTQAPRRAGLHYRQGKRKRGSLSCARRICLTNPPREGVEMGVVEGTGDWGQKGRRKQDRKEKRKKKLSLLLGTTSDT